MASHPTVYIIASDLHRNGKTLLSRMLADYLLLDGHDPFLLDTESATPHLRNYFPGRTQVADFGHVEGQIKIFDKILASTGRDYVIDLSASHADAFFNKAQELNYVHELQKLGYRVIVFFIVDNTLASLRFFQSIARNFRFDLLVPVRNAFVGSAWPNGDMHFDIPVLDEAVMAQIGDRHFSIRGYILGDPQNLPDVMDMPLKRFVYDVMQAFTNLEPMVSLQALRPIH